MTATSTLTSTTTSSLSNTLAQAAQSIISGSTGNSSLDVNSLVSALVTSKTVGQSSAITTGQSTDNTQLTAIGQIKSALSSLQTALTGLSNGSTLGTLAASFSGTGMTATTTSSASQGTHTIKVNSLASTNSLSSVGIASGTALGTGNLTIGLGTKSMQISVGSSDTLSTIAANINNSSSNPGVTATVINATDGQHLVLTSNTSGAANTVSVSGDSSLNSALTSGYNTVSPAADASLTVDGSAVTSASNNVANVIPGVTLNLTSTSVGQTQTLSLAQDTTSITTAINAFVTAYNNVVTTASGLSSYTPASGSTAAAAGPLLGDAMLNSITNGLATIISSGVNTGGSTTSLSALGLDLQPDGTISVDANTLQTALTTNPTAVSAVFNQTNGVATSLNDFLTPYTETSGVIDQRTQSINSDLSSLSDQATALSNYQAQLTSQYNAQFTALNNLMAQMQSNSTYLTQLFGGSKTSGTLNGG